MEYPIPLNTAGVRAFNSTGLGEKVSEHFHISGAIVIPANASTVVTSGQVGFNPDMTLPKDLLQEVLNAFQAVEDALAVAGVKDGFRSVYRMTTYHVGMSEELDVALEAAISKHFGTNRPAWTGVGVAALSEGARIEISAMAILL